MPKSELQNLANLIQKNSINGNLQNKNHRDVYNSFKDFLLHQKENLKIKGTSNVPYWTEDRSLLNWRSLRNLGIKTPSVKTGGSRFSSISQLPVIVEEEGSSEDEKELKNILYENPAVTKNLSATEKLELIDNKPNKKQKIGIRIKEPFKSEMKLPPLVNINCMMNIDIKQSQQIWDTSFGKRLLRQKKSIENIGADFYNFEKKDLKMLTENDSVKSSRFKRFQDSSFIPKKYSNDIKSGIQYKKILIPKTSKKKSSHANKENRHHKPEEPGGSLEIKEIPSKITYKQSKESLPPIDADKIHETSEKSSIFSRKQNFLTECVQSILEGVSNHIVCTFCDQEFTDVEDLVQHKKIHEKEKQTCLLCGKDFYRGNDFIEHLLTHEGVDKFSCKICRKYFPSSKKYKKHCKEFHSFPEDLS